MDEEGDAGSFVENSEGGVQTLRSF